MSVAVVLPARLASTRLPGKLLLDRTGRTVLEHTIGHALKARDMSGGLITTVLTACDDPQLIKVSQRAGSAAMMTRLDHKSGTDRVAEACATLSEEVIVNLQADEPEINPALIIQVATLLTGSASHAPMATLAVPIFDEATWRKPNVVKVVLDAQCRALYFSRAPVPFVREESEAAGVWRFGERRVFGLQHLGLYAYRRAFLLDYAKLPPSRLEQLEKLEQLRALENGHALLVGIAQEHPPGIDTPEEYEAFCNRMALKLGSAEKTQTDYQSDWLDRGATFYGH